ncbi:MAG: histidinol-phosphate transaminase [Gammaproteobacteria bacterium]
MTASIEQYAARGVRSLQPYIPGKPVSELQREYGIEQIIKLASNENPLGPSPAVLDAIRATLPDLACYPDGNGFDLKVALATKLDIPTEWITLGNGSNDILELVARAFLTSDTAAVYSQYAFAVYPMVTQAIGAKACVAAAHDGHDGPAWGHDLKAMAALVTDATRVVFVANPNNPTGTWLASNMLRNFIENLPTHLIIVIDEAYFEYIDEADYPNTLDWISEFPNLLVTRTFSKAYGLAGLRVGYGICQPEMADLLNRVRQPFNVNQPALVAAAAALADDAHLHKSVSLNRASLRMLEQSFEQLGLDYIPSVGNFIAVNVGQDAAQIYADLLREGVIVRPVNNYDMPEYLRISTGNEWQNKRFIEALTKVIR